MTQVNSSYLPARPGNVQMKCLIWANHPVCARLEQSEQFPLNYETLKSLPDYIRNKVTSSPTADEGPTADGVWLRERIIYMSNFLRIKNQLLETYRTDVQAYFDPTLYAAGVLQPISGQAWVPHHMWKLDGDLFQVDVLSPSDRLSGTPASQNPRFSIWNHEVVPVPVEAAPTGVTTYNYVFDPLAAPLLPATDVFMPSQCAVSQATKWVAAALTTAVAAVTGGATAAASTAAANAVATTNPPKGIHWKVTKELPLFQGEDYWVEFRKRANSPDTQPTNDPLLSQYAYLDSQATKYGNVVVNAGVVDIDNAGNIITESTKTFNFNQQAYYIIEMGVGTDHHYIIIIAANGYPRFLHVSSTIPILTINNGQGIVITAPGIDVSRVLSTYKGVNSKALIDQDILRVIVRQHLGKIVVTFSGHEDVPWVIQRQDPIANPGSTAWSQNPQDYSYQTTYMLIASAPLSLYGGNLKSCWSFAPLIYEKSASLQLPQAFMVKGPVTSTDISLKLSEQSPNTSQQGSLKYPDYYYQEAEQYNEYINGKQVITSAWQIDPEALIKIGKAPLKAVYQNKNITNSEIEIIPLTNVISNTTPTTNVSGGQSTVGDGTTGTLVNPLSDNTLMTQSFYAGFNITSGDYVFPVPTSQPSNNVQIIEPYYLSNCITPIATGWRLYIPAAGRAALPTPVDASSLVTEFSDNWAAQDNIKIEHTGTIKFLVSKNQTGAIIPQITIDNINSEIIGQPSDLASYVAALHNKTFYLRIYAWWEGGFGECTPDCPNCGGAGGCNDACCIFTGFCHGGVITTKGSNQKYMECQLFDYMKVLQDSLFLNSPFFDGMRDFNAIYHILKMAGFRDGTENNLTVAGGLFSGLQPTQDTVAPARLIKIFADSSQADNIIVAWPPGCSTSQVINSWEYVLPSSYDILQSPKYKFTDGQKMEEGINKMAAQATKTYYFDALGYFHYENRIEEQLAYTGQNANDISKMNFFVSPIEMSSPKCGQQYRQTIGESYTFRRSVADVVTSVNIMTTTPDGGPVWAGSVNYAAIYDPTSPGYIGYKKMFVQVDGVFGNLEGAQNAVKFYEAQYQPPVYVSFESYGTGRLKPFDIVTFTGMRVDDVELNNQPFRLLSVSSTIDPKSNEWRTKYEGEWWFLNLNGNATISSN